MLLKLAEVSKALQETITESTIRNKIMDNLIKMMTKEKEYKEEEEVSSDEEEETTSGEEEDSSEG